MARRGPGQPRHASQARRRGVMAPARRLRGINRPRPAVLEHPADVRFADLGPPARPWPTLVAAGRGLAHELLSTSAPCRMIMWDQRPDADLPTRDARPSARKISDLKSDRLSGALGVLLLGVLLARPSDWMPPCAPDRGQTPARHPHPSGCRNDATPVSSTPSSSQPFRFSFAPSRFSARVSELVDVVCISPPTETCLHDLIAGTKVV